jgi:hypothetical protein
MVTNGIAQESTLKLQIDPSDNYRVRINNGEQHRTNYFKVFPGEVKLSIWAPGYLIIDTILDLGVDEQRVFVGFLEKSDEYKDWLENKRLLNEKAIKMQLPPALLTLSLAVFSVVQQVQFLDATNQLESTVRAYDLGYTPGLFDEIRVNYEDAQDNYRKQRTQLIIGYTLTAASTAFLIYQVKKAKKIKIPDFIDPYKLQFEGVSYSPRFNNSPSSVQGAFSFKF